MAQHFFDSYDAIIIDPDQAGRMKLKQVARAIPEFSNVRTVSTLKEALDYLNNEHECDVVFISNVFDDHDIMDFHKIAIETNVGSVCSYIQVLKGNDKKTDDIAKGMITGMSGFLLEPFSVDSLREITELAAKIRIKETRKRVQIASKIVASTLVKEVDRLAALRAIDKDSEKSDAALSATKLIASISEEALDVYYDVLADSFMEAVPPITSDYDGSSKRVKQRMDKKIKSELADKLDKELQEDAAKIAKTKVPPKKKTKPAK